MKSSDNKKIIGEDFGGTKVAIGLVNGSEIVKQEYHLIPNIAIFTSTV